MKVKRVYISKKTKEIEPLLYGLCFSIDSTYYFRSYAAYSLEDAVRKATNNDQKLNLKTLFYHNTLSLSQIRDKFKNI